MSAEPIQVCANAKINVGLAITGKLANGYHTISTIFLEIRFADHLKFMQLENSDVEFSCSGIPLPEGDNLCVQAVDLIRQRTGCSRGIRIHLEKNIPIGAGLGGGSSDAAAVVNTLNRLWNLQLSSAELKAAAVELGADVPFFIDGGIQYASGIGEKLSPIPPEPFFGKHILLVFPGFQVSTPWAYGQLKYYLNSYSDENKFRTLPAAINWQFFENDFEQVIVSTYPEAGAVKNILRDSGALLAGLSGSGSTMFGIFDSQDCARQAENRLGGYHTFLTSPALVAS